ncbi:Response regulator receiver sensor signal transduction histidine kinase [Operophtera brumata]|uniref:Response regulator receiver sensor signal transduction histidine kinase n=1 Tax=Operophtera brumata TaxID=104452 RepID=A0A0L7LC87_OPEBR|nr:Response regulator receiver sensor signal transduction histidine kinase [Operophtera brumata]
MEPISRFQVPRPLEARSHTSDLPILLSDSGRKIPNQSNDANITINDRFCQECVQLVIEEANNRIEAHLCIGHLSREQHSTHATL